jgi:hypothetical protein
MNRIVGVDGECPFGDVEKEKFIELIKRASQYFTVEVLSYQIMGNHWHIVCYAPAMLLCPRETAKRYNKFYAGKKPLLRSGDAECERVARYMRDVGGFIGWIEQCFADWFNKTRTPRRRGTLWGGRFKSSILDRDTALWECICYAEMNSVRAHLVQDPADYRFGSWGEWCSTGKHPFAANLKRRLPEFEGEQSRSNTLADIEKQLRVDLARRKAADAGAPPGAIEEAMTAAAKTPSFALRLDRRVRYWTDGLVIGTKKFVVEMAARSYGMERASQQRLKRAKRNGQDTDLWAYSRLRSLPA